jgi:AcrR family transcriptional regulator
MPAADSPRRYHHGDLRNAMIEAAVELVREGGAESVTIREAARRAGVSSGAPFRHFPNRTALMTAVAEEGMARLRASIEARLAACASDHPLVRLSAIGEGYFAWASQHPTHYRVVGDRTQIDFAGSEILSGDNRWIREQMLALFDRAHTEGLLRPCDLAVVHLQCRALAYGLARMHVDGHLPEFGVAPDQAIARMRAAMQAFILSLARDPEALRRELV